jgi:hypothetical protein
VIGAPYMTGNILPDRSIQLAFSKGSATNTGYKCHYLGNSKILEINSFAEQGQIYLAMTIPKVPGWVGFGFDNNHTLADAFLFVAQDGLTWQAIGHNQSLSTTFQGVIDADSSESQSIFQLGQDTTVDVLLSTTSVQSQSLIYYANGDSFNSTIVSKHTNTEKYTFSVLHDKNVECTNFLQPSRAEIYSSAATGTMLGIYVVTFILLCIFSRAQPLYSRGISPFLTLFFLFTQLLLEIRNYFFVTPFQGSLCFYYAFGYYPLQQVCFLMILIYFIRYFSIIKMNESKALIYNNAKVGKQVGKHVDKLIEWKIKILKATSSTWFTLGVLILSYILVLIAFVGALIPNNFECRFDNLTYLKTIHNV